VDVLAQMNFWWKKQVEENRRRLIPIIQTIHFCGKQGVALRGTQDFGALSLEEPDILMENVALLSDCVCKQVMLFSNGIYSTKLL